MNVIQISIVIIFSFAVYILIEVLANRSEKRKKPRVYTYTFPNENTRTYVVKSETCNNCDYVRPIQTIDTDGAVMLSYENTYVEECIKCTQQQTQQ